MVAMLQIFSAILSPDDEVPVTMETAPTNYPVAHYLRHYCHHG